MRELTRIDTLGLKSEVSSPKMLLDILIANADLEALVIRNAGTRAKDAFRSLEVMGTINPIGLIVVVHHTGM